MRSFTLGHTIVYHCLVSPPDRRPKPAEVPRLLFMKVLGSRIILSSKCIAFCKTNRELHSHRSCEWFY